MAIGMDEIDETQAPLLDHLIELRARLVRCVLALMVAFGICLYFAEPILGFLIQPLKGAFPDGDGQLIFTNPLRRENPIEQALLGKYVYTSIYIEREIYICIHIHLYTYIENTKEFLITCLTPCETPASLCTHASGPAAREVSLDFVTSLGPRVFTHKFLNIKASLSCIHPIHSIHPPAESTCC